MLPPLLGLRAVESFQPYLAIIYEVYVEHFDAFTLVDLEEMDFLVLSKI